MLVYIILFVFLLFGVFINPKKQKTYLILSFVLLFIVSAFRDVSVGTDTESYEWLFDRVADGYMLHRQEIGWYYLNKIIIFFGGDFQWLLIVSTLLVLLPVFIIVRKYSMNPMLSIFLFYAFYLYLQSFNITRQIVSVSMAFYCLPFLISRKWKTYMMGLFGAFLFHMTAIFSVLFLFAKKIPYNKMWWAFFLILSLIFGVVLSSVLLPKVTEILGYTHYLQKFDSEEETGLFLLLTNLFALWLIITSSNKSIYLQLFFVYILFYNLVSSVPFAYRLVYFFSVVQLLFIPYYVFNNTLNNRQVAMTIVIIYACLFFIRSFGAAGVIPYKGFFF